MPVFMAVPGCFDDSGLVIQFDIRYCNRSCFVLLSQNCCGYSCHLWFQINFGNVCSMSVKYAIGILIGIALNLKIALGSMDILVMLILPIHEYVHASICLCLP